MYKYRVPSQILWVNDGYREVEADDPFAALTHFRGRGMRVDASHIQVQHGDNWYFAETTPANLGGYNQGRL